MNITTKEKRTITKPLTDRARAFCRIYVENGYNGKRAYMEAYQNESETTSQTGAYQLLKDPRVQSEISFMEGTYKSLAYKVWLTKEKVVQTLINMMNATKIVAHKDWTSEVVPDWTARNNAILQYSKLTWDFNEKNKEIEKKVEAAKVDTMDTEMMAKLSAEQLQERKAAIMESINSWR